MKLSKIKKLASEKANRLGTYYIKDGTHEGVVQSVEYNEEANRVYLKIKLTNGTIYKNSSDVADYASKPMFKVIEPFVDENEEIDFSDIKNYDVTFTTKTSTSKDGHKFSNIKDFEYLYSDSDEQDE
ncbi:MAG: hypothetical protein K2J47_10790 [Ruminococcus sp.]|nr:hypothetical protein [Ruminococcus sp.]